MCKSPQSPSLPPLCQISAFTLNSSVGIGRQAGRKEINMFLDDSTVFWQHFGTGLGCCASMQAEGSVSCEWMFVLTNWDQAGTFSCLCIIRVFSLPSEKYPLALEPLMNRFITIYNISRAYTQIWNQCMHSRVDFYSLQINFDNDNNKKAAK